jgi:hypothetical protein
MKTLVHILIFVWILVLRPVAASRYEMALPEIPQESADFFAVRDALREAISEFVQSDEDFQLLVFPTLAEELAAGRLSRVEISFRGGEIQGLEGLKVRRGRVVATDLSFDLEKLLLEKKLKVDKVGSMQFRVRVDEEDINSYLSSGRRNLNLDQPQLDIKEGRIQFSARVRTLFFSSRVMTEGSFELNKEKQTIDFRATQLKMNSIGVPRFALGSIVSKINPVLRLKNFSLVGLLSLNLEEIQIGDGFVEFSGS